MDVALQSRTPEHGLGRQHPQSAAGHGRVTLLQASVKNGGITVGFRAGWVRCLRAQTKRKMGFRNRVDSADIAKSTVVAMVYGGLKCLG